MRKIVIALVVGSFLATACQPQPKPTGWTLLDTPNHPPAVFHSGLAYDLNSHEAVLFGGGTDGDWSDETWTWDGRRWLEVKTSIRPSAREKTAMAYDEARDKIVLFGGATATTVFDDTWEWDGKAWQLQSPAHQPPARCCHALAYDSVQKKVLLYGGWNGITGEFFNDTWEWDGTDWTDVSCCDAPLASGHTLVNFPSLREVVAVPATEFANTWVWDGAGWQQIPAYPDPARHDAPGAYDSQYERIVLWGGITQDRLLDETWIFDGQVWNYVNLDAPPPSRWGHAFFYDTQRHSLIMFGGYGRDGILADTWELYLPEDIGGLLSAAAPEAEGPAKATPAATP